MEQSNMDELFTQALKTRFDSTQKNTPYQSEDEYIRDLMSLISLHLVSAVSYKSACAENARADRGTQNLSGTAMSMEEAVCYMGEYPASLPRPVPELPEVFAAARTHIDSRALAAQQAGMFLHLERIRALLQLSDFAFFAMLCALSCALDRGFERLFVSLHGDVELPFPTLGAVQACYGLAHPPRPEDWQSLLDPSSAENRLLFAPPSLGKPPLLRPLALRPSILGYILHRPHFSRELSACSTMLDGTQGADEPLFVEAQLGAARAAVEEMRRRIEPRLCILCGAPGSGKKLTLQKIAAEKQMSFLLVRLEELSDACEEIAEEITVLSMFWGCIPCFILEEAKGNTRFMRILGALSHHRIGALLLTTRLHSNIVIEGILVTRIDYSAPNLEQSLHFWRLFSTAHDTAAAIDWVQLSAKYMLSPGQIKSALQGAADIAKAKGAPMETKEIDDAILFGNTGRLSEIADKINVFYTWDDLVLGDVPKQMLKDVCNRIKYRHVVEARWGFGAKSAYGTGISILLYGPPGTGKTMSAQVIAGELGLPIYRINLAQIISKYIGETAKNLDTVFSEAKSSNVILFFDEADALFAKRTDIKNSNDRHANSESSYLLQKIEEYTGISILATNLASNFDEAFRRRINYMVNIHMPSPAQRLELWRNSIPERALLSPDVDLRLLADNLEFSGSIIKSAALQAAYFAASENTQISMSHITRAVRRELQKLGKSEPHFLQMYSDGGTCYFSQK